MSDHELTEPKSNNRFDPSTGGGEGDLDGDCSSEWLADREHRCALNAGEGGASRDREEGAEVGRKVSNSVVVKSDAHSQGAVK